MEDIEKKYRIGAEISGDSTWTFASEPAAGSSTTTAAYCFSDQESRILSEFGWNLPPESDDRSRRIDGGLEPFGSFLPEEPSDSTGTFRLPENLPSPQPPSVPEMERSGEENPSISSSLSEEPPARSAPESEGKQVAEISKNAKKKVQKRCRLPQIAFLTKSEIDHLEDGYRWRKYGQKAVKNSSYPRSYYRCTNSKCMVKKRVERSHSDPTIVVTTYEGQHCHHTIPLRRGCTTSSPSQPFYFQPHTLLHQLPTDEGLLHDMVLPRMQHNI